MGARVASLTVSAFAGVRVELSRASVVVLAGAASGELVDVLAAFAIGVEDLGGDVLDSGATGFDEVTGAWEFVAGSVWATCCPPRPATNAITPTSKSNTSTPAPATMPINMVLLEDVAFGAAAAGGRAPQGFVGGIARGELALSKALSRSSGLLATGAAAGIANTPPHLPHFARQAWGFGSTANVAAHAGQVTLIFMADTNG
jgi:hypothetical protein